MYGLAQDELRLLRSLNSPGKIQDYLDRIPINFEPGGDTCLSPRRVIRENRAHCIEAAMLAAVAFRLNNEPPLVLHLASCAHDFDHVVALFKRQGCWGAVSKTNHAVLRYREPVYRTLRELALSYFHEYTDDNGRKTLRSYSLPIKLSRFDKMGWITNEDDNWDIAIHLAESKHFPLLNRSQIAALRKAHPTEIKAGKIVQWKKG